MTTERKPISGRGQDSYPPKLDKYNKDSKSKALGRHMRTFSRGKTGQMVTAWDDQDYLLVLNNYFKSLADVSGGVDAATVGSPQFLAWLDETWELHYTNANLKDLVAGEESAWQLYFCCSFFIAMATQIQYNFRCYLPAYTEADGVPGSTSNIPYFSQSSFDIFLGSMANYPIPKGVWELVDTLGTWGVSLGKSYEKYTLRIPECVLFPFNDYYDLEDLEAARDIMRINLGNTITHAQKFGLKMGKWRDPVKPTIKQFNDPDVIALFNHLHLTITDKDPALIEFSPNGGFGGANLTTDYTLTEYMFLDDPNESPLHVLAPIFGIYDATNNPYGGWVLSASVATEYYISAMHCKQHGDNILEIKYDTYESALWLLLLHKCVSDNAVADGKFNIGVFGTQLTVEQGFDDVWSLALFCNCFTGSNRGATETNNDLLNYLGRLLV